MDKNEKIKQILEEEFCSKSDLMEHLKRNTGVFKDKNIENAFNKIDRKDFVSEDYKCEAYEDYPLPIEYGQTISQPTTVAFMLELLDVKKGEEVLDIGSGSGWTTALLSEIVGEEGKVLGIEIVPELVKLGQENLKKYDFKNTKIVHTKSLGPPTAKWDRILVSASFKKEIPFKYMDQLKDGGVLVAPVDDKICKLEKVGDNEINQKCYEGFSFVPYVYE